MIRYQVEQGQVSVPLLLTAQQAFLQTSLARVQAEAIRLADTVALFQALGGGWWNRTDVDAASKGAPRVFDLPPAKDIKLPRGGAFGRPAQEERFLREARSVAQLRHPGIVAVHNTGRDQGTVPALGQRNEFFARY